MKSIAVRASAATLLAALLTACGGGQGGGGNSGPPPPHGYSRDFEGICTVPAQKQFVRAYLDEVYLWYDEIPVVDADSFSNVTDYFNALLVKTRDANGQPKDRFSAVLPSGAANHVLSQAPAAARGPALLQSHTSFVPVARAVRSPAGRRVGYVQFNDHETGAQDDLIDAFRQLRDAGVQDLVLDLRFNSGGFLYIARTAASMIVGPSSEGRVFEQLRYNDKRTALTEASVLNFAGTVQVTEAVHPAGTALPQLGLTRAYVLTSSQTCSSSESIINGLRGIGVAVVQVGATTCGKPYGFQRKDNCGLAFFPVEFKGANAQGFGDYTTGFAPTCAVADDPRVAAGSTTDPLLDAALFHIDNGRCPAAQPRADAALSVGPASAPSRPAWAGRLLAPPR